LNSPVYYNIIKMETVITPIPNQSEVDSSYSAICDTLINNKLMFACCTHFPRSPAVIYNLDISSNKIIRYLDTHEILKKENQHGKIHTPIVIDNNFNLYCATHFAYPYGLPQPTIYSGSKMIKITKYGKNIDLGTIKINNGAITMTIDKKRNLIYILTVPKASLIQYDINKNKYIKLGNIPSKECVSRSITIDKKGNVYGCYENGGIFIYFPEKNNLVFHNNFLPYQKNNQWNSNSRKGVNKLDRSMWRNILFCPKRNMLFGLLNSNSKIFSLAPSTMKISIGNALYPKNTISDKRKMFPTLSLASDDDKILYSTSTGLFDYCRSEHINGWSHLMMVNKSNLKSTDLGIISNGIRRVYGIMAATVINDEYYGVGAVEHINNETYNQFNIINGQPYILAVIKIRYEK
jgi:hypothetical protein